MLLLKILNIENGKIQGVYINFFLKLLINN